MFNLIKKCYDIIFISFGIGADTFSHQIKSETVEVGIGPSSLSKNVMIHENGPRKCL